eukprot:1141061-Pelagomonas_calceolata.AAC.7
MLTSICVQQVLGALQEKEQSKHQRQQQNDSSRRTPTCFTGSQNTAGHTGQQVLATERCLVSTSMAHRHIVPPFTEGCRKPIACLKIEM